MINIKGFLSIPSLATNVDSQVSLLGELSTRSRTFSKDIGIFVSPTKPNIEFLSFSALDGTLTPVSIPPSIASAILDVMHFIYDEATDGNTILSTPQLILDLATEFTGDGVNFEVGPLVTVGGISLPEWVSWRVLYNAEEHPVRVWISDPAFITQYKETSLTVVSVIPDLDALFGAYGDVNTLINSLTFSQMIQASEVAKDEKPYTYFEPLVTNWTYPADSQVKKPVTFGILIYGEAGRNDDIMRNAVVEYILANSTHDREEWKTVFPELFVNTEFIITPLFDRIAIPNQTPSSGLYSGTIFPSDVLDYANLTRGDYTESHVEYAARASFFTYKCLAFTILGGSENLDGINRFEQKFPDYIPVSTSSLDFQRMSPETQAWANRMNEMLPIAENLTEETTLPANMSQVMRNGVLFLSTRLDNVLYLIAAKANAFYS